MSRSLAVFLSSCFVLPACSGPALDSGEPEVPEANPSVANAAGHHFRARPHRPRNHTAPPAPPALASLPQLIDRRAECFGYGEDEDQAIARPYPSKPRPKSRGSRRKKKRSGGGVGYGRGAGSSSGGSSSGAVSSPSAQPAPAPTPAPAPAGGASRDFTDAVATGDALGGTGVTAPADAAPMAEESVREAGPSKRERREARKQDRKNRRDKSKDRVAEAPAVASQDGGGEVAYEAEPDPMWDAYHDWGAAIYLSNDDTMSLSSAQRVIYAIDNFLPLPAQHIRPHELLNYFSFDTPQVPEGHDFAVGAEVVPDPEQEGIYTLSLAVRGRPLDRETRRNAALTLVVDRSGSMSDEGRMDYLKRGLTTMLDELKRGDTVNLVAFDHSVCTPIENFVVGRDSMSILQSAVAQMQPRGSTDVHSGLETGYRLADAGHQPAYSNRVVLVTDALANTGVTDPGMMSMISKYYDSRRIRLSGVGVGRNFNDALLDRLTERGKGAYVFLGSEAEVDAVFGPRFVSLIETTANDVHFRLHLPPSLRMNVFYGEESSVVREDVQAIHYFANTSQLFLSDLMAYGGQLAPADDVMLSVEYEDPESGAEMAEDFVFNLAEIDREGRNSRKGRLVMRFIDGLAWMSTRPLPANYRGGAGSWDDAESYQACADGTDDLQRMAAGLEDDPEVRRVMGLWDKYCSRYERPRNPVRRRPVAVDDRWPGASE